MQNSDSRSLNPPWPHSIKPRVKPRTLAFKPLLRVAPTSRRTQAAGPCRHRPTLVRRRPTVTGVWPAHRALSVLPLARPLSLSFESWARRRECGVARLGQRRPSAGTPSPPLLSPAVENVGSGVVDPPCPCCSSPRERTGASSPYFFFSFFFCFG